MMRYINMCSMMTFIKSTALWKLYFCWQELQRDIEQHGSGVASVLNLCEVLLRDSDACPTVMETTAIEQACDSLGRRWRNICALSMEQKLK